MTVKKLIEPSTWPEFLTQFSERNRDRRARFELFRRDGEVAEESREGHFDGATVDGRIVTIKRTYETSGESKTMSDELHDTHGIEVQYDTDGSEDTIEFTDHKGDMTVLHFESRVDGDS
ncbi:MAG: hypothetical protein ACREO5_03985 [Candidatus Binatia bacterium]